MSNQRKLQAVTVEVRLPPAEPVGVDEGCLVVVAGPRLGHVVHVHDIPVIIGRARQADFQIDDPSVSRLHCAVWHEFAGVHVRDLESRNGLLVNGVPMSRAELASGDQLRLGDVMLKFVLADSVEAHYHETLYGLATLDSLTQLPNRREFGDSLAAAVTRSAEVDAELSVVIFDLDHFKQVNDVLGHDAGDTLLRNLAGILRSLLRAGDDAGRLGGDEFAVLLRETGTESAQDWCEQLRAATEAMGRELPELAQPVSASIGVATWKGSMLTAREVLRKADMALLRAKAAGRNCVRTATDAD